MNYYGRGRCGPHIWHVWTECPGVQWFHAERVIEDEVEYRYLKAHCLACAKVEVLAKYGGQVDLRGWHRQGNCGVFLKTMQIATKQEQEEKEE